MLAQDRDSWRGFVNLSVCMYTCLQTLILKFVWILYILSTGDFSQKSLVV